MTTVTRLVALLAGLAGVGFVAPAGAATSATPLKASAPSATPAAAPAKPAAPSATLIRSSSVAPASATVAAQPAASATLAAQPAPSATVAAVAVPPPAAPVPAVAPVQVAGRASRKFIPVIDADVRGAYSRVRHGGVGASGLVGTVLVLPGWRITEGSTLLPIYSFDGSLFNHVVEEDILYQSRQVHAGSLGFKQVLGPVDGRIAVEADYALTKESKNEKLGRGLYDYRDFGGRLGAGWRDAGLSATARAYRRTYVHFFSLASAALTKELRPKDFDGLDTGLEWKGNLGDRLRMQGGYTLGLRDYRDKYLRSDQGLVTDTRRFDSLHRVTDGAALALGNCSLGVDAEGLLNLSNGSIYDLAQPVHPYIPSYFQFWSASLEPSATWSFPMPENRHAKLRVGAGVTTRSYTDRLAQDAVGVYTDSHEHDAEYSVALAGSVPMARWLWLTGGVEGRVARSNTRFEKYLQSNYELLTASLGLHVSY